VRENYNLINDYYDLFLLPNIIKYAGTYLLFPGHNHLFAFVY